MKPKKSLGQNFLKSEKALNQMIDSAGVCGEDVVLEIGPGKGALTEKLLTTGAKVLAVEKDSELIPLLEEKFSKEIADGKFILIKADILEFNPSAYSLKPGAYKLVANIPYYITGAIIRKFLESDFQPESITLLVQKEVSDRIVGRDGKESILSISVKVYGEPKYIAKVSKRYFIPEPKVDSAIIHIRDISKKNFKNIKEDEFFNILKTGFSHKRKTLIKNLESLNIPKEFLISVFGDLNISLNERAENIDLKTWISLTHKLLK